MIETKFEIPTIATETLLLRPDGIADFYGELLDGIVADEDVGRLTTLQTDTRMDDATARSLGTQLAGPPSNAALRARLNSRLPDL